MSTLSQTLTPPHRNNYEKQLENNRTDGTQW